MKCGWSTLERLKRIAKRLTLETPARRFASSSPFSLKRVVNNEIIKASESCINIFNGFCVVEYPFEPHWSIIFRLLAIHVRFMALNGNDKD